MLPLGVYPLTQIEQEKNPVNQVIQLVSLLEYLLNFVNPGHLFEEILDVSEVRIGRKFDGREAVGQRPHFRIPGSNQPGAAEES